MQLHDIIFYTGIMWCSISVLIRRLFGIIYIGYFGMIMHSGFG